MLQKWNKWLRPIYEHDLGQKLYFFYAHFYDHKQFKTLAEHIDRDRGQFDFNLMKQTHSYNLNHS